MLVFRFYPFTFFHMRKKIFSLVLVVSIGVLLSACSGASTGSSSGGGSSRGQKTDLTNAETDITYFKAKAKMKVNSITMDFFPGSEKVLKDPKTENKQFVCVNITFTNTGAEKFSANYTQASLETSGGMETTTFYINDSNKTGLLKTKDLANGESVTGDICYEAPASDTLDKLSQHYKGYDGDSLKDLDAVVPFKK